jgi:hypothetical protein
MSQRLASNNRSRSRSRNRSRNRGRSRSRSRNRARSRSRSRGRSRTRHTTQSQSSLESSYSGLRRYRSLDCSFRRESEVDPVVQNQCNVKITKNIANAFMAFGCVPVNNDQQHVNSGIENYRQESRTSIMEYNEDNQPRFLKGIDSYHDLGKSDEVLNSLFMIKECFFINKLKKNFTPENEAKRLLGSLAKKALDEILENKDADNPKWILRNLKKYKEQESNPVLSFLWFVRDIK